MLTILPALTLSVAKLVALSPESMQITDENMEHGRVRTDPWDTPGGSFIGSGSAECKSCIPVIRQAAGSSSSAAYCLCHLWYGVPAPDSCFFICNGGNWSSHQHPLGFIKEMSVCVWAPSHSEILTPLVCRGPQPQYFKEAFWVILV